MSITEIRKNHHIGSQHIEEAINNGERGCSCSEAVLAAYGEFLGLERNTAIKISSGFGGGMGLRGDTCGAVTAAFMVLGLMFGTSDLADGYTRQKTYMLIDDFAERFIRRYGSLDCRRLCAGHDMSTAEGAKALRSSGRPQQMIRASTEILEEVISEEIDEGQPME